MTLTVQNTCTVTNVNANLIHPDMDSVQEIRLYELSCILLFVLLVP